jgi:hypothetical protein
MSQPSNILDGYKKFRKARLDLNLVPLEASPSIPIPFIYQNSVYLTILYYLGSRLKGQKKIQIYRPISKIIFNPINVKLVCFIDYRLKDDFPETDWTKPIGEFPHESIATISLKEYMKRKDQLIYKYDQVVNAMNDTAVVTEWKSEFINEFYSLCSPCLIHFLKKTSPTFFKWLDN